jgi:hypothetical protein
MKKPARGHEPEKGIGMVMETLAFAKQRDKRRKANKLARRARKKNRGG